MKTETEKEKVKRRHMRLMVRVMKAVGGNQSELARRIGKNVVQGHVYQWCNGLTPVSSEFAVLIERAVDGAVGREEFNPHIFEGFVRAKQESRAA